MRVIIKTSKGKKIKNKGDIKMKYGTEKQIAWAEEIKANLMEAIEITTALRFKNAEANREPVKAETKIIAFARWFCENCEDAVAMIAFKDVKMLKGATLNDYRISITKMASKPEVKSYVDRYFA